MIPSEHVRMDVAGVGSSLLGVFAFSSAFMPWVLLYFDTEYSDPSIGLTLENWPLSEAGLEHVFFGLLLALGLFSIASLALTRATTAIVALVGLAATISSYFYLFAQVESLGADANPALSEVTAFPHAGVSLAAVCYLAILVLQFIPRLNGSGRER